MIEDPGIVNVAINLSQLPASGTNQLLVRVRSIDRKDVNKAAQILGLKQSEFTRAAIVLLARKVTAEFAESTK